VAWKDVLVKTETDLGPNALTNPDGSATPQLAELGRIYALLAPHTEVIRRWHRQDSPKVEADGDGQVQVFTDTDNGNIYAVVVNDDLHETRTVGLRLDGSIKSLTDVVHSQEVPLTAASPGSGSTCQIRLDAGDGTILLLKAS
jgi:hypothetical protein